MKKVIQYSQQHHIGVFTINMQIVDTRMQYGFCVPADFYLFCFAFLFHKEKEKRKNGIE